MKCPDEGKILGALLIGGILGAGLALLFAPQSGKKTRKDISRFAGRVRDDVEDKAESIVEAIEDLTAKIGDKISEAASRGKELEEDVKNSLLKAVEKSQKAIEKQKARLGK
jgi:gas vesicle protein